MTWAPGLAPPPTVERALARALDTCRPPDGKVVEPAAKLHKLQAAAGELGNGDIAAALQTVNKIREFGLMSFGSKVLMAMEPQKLRRL